MIQWRPELSEVPSHFTDIDNGRSELIESRATLNDGKFDDEDTLQAKVAKRAALEAQGYCQVNVPISDKEQTLFINAAIEGVEEGTQHLPWLLEIQLPQNEDAPCGLSEADTTARVIDEPARVVDSTHLEEAMATAPTPNKKRRADAIKEVALIAEMFPPRQPSKRMCRRALGGIPAEPHEMSAYIKASRRVDM